MSTENVKKAILFHWMYRIFVTKEFDRSEFKDRRAIEILNMANFNIPFNKAIKPFLDATTNEFKEAMKNKTVLQLLAAYPLPKIIGIEEEEEIPELEDSFKDLSVESKEEEAVPMVVEEAVAREPTVGELQASIEKIIENGDLETLTNKMIIKNLEEIYGLDLSHRKKEIKQIIERVINEPEEAQPIIEEEDIIMPVHNPIKEKKKSSKKAPKEKKEKKEPKPAPDANAGRRGELRDKYWKINDRIGTLRAFVARDSDFLYDMHGNVNKQLQAQINEYNKEIKQLKEEIYKVEDELYSIPVPSRWDGKFGTQPDLFERIEDDEETPKKKSNSMKNLFKTLNKPTIEGEMPDEIKSNLKYVAFLSYYAISPLIAVEDPTLEDIYRLYPDLETQFKTSFANLTIKERYEFIKSIFNGRSFKQVNQLIEKGEPLNPSENGIERSIAVSLNNFKHSTPKVDDEIEYNLMYYVEPNKEFSKDVMVANIVNELKRKTKSDDEDIKSKVEKALGVASDRTSILERVHTSQLSNIKDYIHKHYSSLTSQSDEEMRTIQVHYEEVRPPLRFSEMEESEGKLPLTNLLYSVSGSSEYRSDLLNIAKTIKNSTYETEIYNIKKEIEGNDRITNLGKTDRKEAELKYINKQINKGELSQVAGKALTTFVDYYDSVSSLPSSIYEKNRMFEYKRIDDLPEQFRPAAEKELRRRLAQMLNKHNAHLTEQKDALTKIQIELNAPKLDIISISDKINRLEASEEVKNKLLTKIQKEGKINVFITFKQLSNKMRINPLIYHGFNRSKRLIKTTEEMSELDKIKAAFPKSNHTISYCFTQLYLKPWLNLPNTFDYFITHPMDLEKEDMTDRERFLYGQKINRTIEGHDNLYRPTTIFWRVYCTEFMIYRNNKYNCMKKMKSDLINPETRQYILGIYNTSTTDEFRVLTEEDYKKECDWFNNSDMGSLTTFDNIASINLNKNIKLARFARDRMKEQIKGVLALIYNAHDISLKNENRLNLDAKKIENEIYEAATSQGKTIFYKYVYDVLNFLYLINPSSPLYPFTGFYQRLLLTSSKNNYATLIKMSKNMSEVFPEIYLIDNKKEFLEIVESKLREDTINAVKNIRVTVEPGFKFPTASSSNMSINYNEKINKKLASFDHSKFKNLCVNYDQVKDPFFVTEIENQLICVGKEEFHAILRDDIGVTLTIPQEVIDRVKYLAKTDKSDDLKRIFTMQYVADDFASSHFNVLNILKEVFDEDHITDKKDLKELIDGSEEIQKAIKMVETELESKLSDKETELFINHLMSQGYNYFIQSIKKYIDTTEFSDELKGKLINEYKRRYNIYYDEKLMKNDRTERISILKDLINTLSNKYGDSINDDLKEIIVDYFHTRHILPLVKDIKRDSHDHTIRSGNPFYTPQCSVCYKFANKDDAVKTYLFKDGKKVLAEFCSTKCMEKVSEKEFEIPKDVKEMTLHSLIDKLVNPISLTYEELIHRTKLIGMSLPEGISFIQAYVSWLSNSSFADSIWLNIQHETLDKIAKHYNIKEDDVKYLWRDLIAKSDFYSLFHSKLEELATPYSKYVATGLNQETYSPDCKYPKAQVENWLENAAQHLFPQDWINHSFNTFDFNVNVFNPFFQTFKGCSDIINSVKERKNAKRNKQFIMDIIMYIGNYNVREKDRNALKRRIENNVQKMNIENKDIIEYSRNLLIEKLQIKVTSQPLENVIYKRMNERYGDNAPLTILATDFKLDINDSNITVELYRDLLLKLGLDFINKYVNMMNAVKQIAEEAKKSKKGSKGRKLPSEYKGVLDAENELLSLKEKSAELTNKEIALRKSIEEKKRDIEISIANESAGRWAPEVLEDELKELQKALSDIFTERLELDFEIEDAENATKEKQDKYMSKFSGSKKQALPQKKGVFRKVKEAAKEEKVEKSEMNPAERRIQIENTLKYNLFNAISSRLPENFNLYNVAEILGLNEKGSIFATDVVLTSKMIKEGKKSLDVGDIEDDNIVEEMGVEEIELGEDEAESVDKENLEQYVEDNDADEGDDLGEKEGEYGEEPEDDDYSY